MELLLPEGRAPALTLPSYVKLDMAFGVGAGALLFDKSRYRSHGTITTATWAAGAHGRALDFNSATPDYVEIPIAQTQLDFTSQDFSIIARINVDNLAAIGTIFIRGQRNVDGYRLFTGPVGQLFFNTHQLAAQQESTSSANSLVVDTWYTIGMSRVGAGVKLYINGIEDTAVPGVHIAPVSNARHAVIGTRDNLFTNPYDGTIEFLRIFGGIELSASEHLAYHNALA